VAGEEAQATTRYPLFGRRHEADGGVGEPMETYRTFSLPRVEIEYPGYVTASTLGLWYR
jgi:hypothetical protein